MEQKNTYGKTYKFKSNYVAVNGQNTSISTGRNCYIGFKM